MDLCPQLMMVSTEIHVAVVEKATNLITSTSAHADFRPECWVSGVRTVEVMCTVHVSGTCNCTITKPGAARDYFSWPADFHRPAARADASATSRDEKSAAQRSSTSEQRRQVPRRVRP
jgi:hypothetical protein